MTNILTRYEVPVDNNFGSNRVCNKPIFGAVEEGFVQETIVRKITALDFEPLAISRTGTRKRLL